MLAEAVSLSRLRIEGDDLLVSLNDLAMVADVAGARANALSLIPAGDGRTDTPAVAEYLSMATGTKNRLAIALGILRAPAKIAHWQHTIADETVTRAVLAWSPSAPNMIVGLAGSSDPRRITFWTQASVTASIRKILAAEGELRSDEIGCKVSTPAVVVFLAAVEQMRAERLHSMLTHTVALEHFSQAEMMERLRDAASEDFRWPLLFVEKLIPGRMVPSLSEQQVSVALEELLKANLIEKASDGEVARYELSYAGKVITDGLLHDVSKVALAVTDLQGEGKFGHDVLLLVRSAFQLFMFAMAGQAGMVASLDRDELAAALYLALRPPAPAASAPEKPAALASVPPPIPAAKPASASWFLSRDGKSEGPCDEAALKKMLEGMPPETLVWSEGMPEWISARDAGLVVAPASVTCPRCGTKTVAGKRFCGECGGPIK